MGISLLETLVDKAAQDGSTLIRRPVDRARAEIAWVLGSEISLCRAKALLVHVGVPLSACK